MTSHRQMGRALACAFAPLAALLVRGFALFGFAVSSASV
jgi:hypothetical protein